jgi:predicted  nucleic acid-binding Zn-ribbon protein
MSNEEKIQKQIEFIIEHQAQFTSDIQQLREVQATTENLLGRLAAATAAGFKGLNEKVSTLVDSQIQTQDSLVRLAEAQARTDLKLSETDERMSSLITVFERYINQGRNGKSQS